MYFLKFSFHLLPVSFDHFESAEQCALIFNRTLNYRWYYHNTLCGHTVSTIGVVLSIALMALMGCLDFVTFAKLHAYQKVWLPY